MPEKHQSGISFFVGQAVFQLLIKPTFCPLNRPQHGVKHKAASNNSRYCVNTVIASVCLFSFCGHRHRASFSYDVFFQIIIQILTAHEGNGGKLLHRGEIQPWPSIPTEPTMFLSRSRLNFTEGAIIFYHPPNEKAVTICFI